MRAFKKLQKRLGYLPQPQIDLIYQAFSLASTAHYGQKRDSGEAYINHPIAVAAILADMHMDKESIMAALLHDVIEDTPTEKQFVIDKFGQTVADLVDGVTKLGKMQFSSVAEAQAESFRKMILAMSHDIRVVLIKLADRLHNMRTIDSLPSHKQRRISRETLEIYAPIANRLGIHDLYIELESLSFTALYPLRCRALYDAVKRARGNRKEIMSEIEKAVRKHFVQSTLPKVDIFGREKHIYSIYKKMLKKHISFSEIMDVYAFRILVDNIDQCYQALGIVHSLYKPVPGRFKDYIAIPKINGYQSLHTTLFGPHGVPIEIQIRTQQMDQIASKGIAAHWLYKTDEKIDESHIRAQQWINDLLQLQRQTGSSLEFIENVKTDLFPSEIYVFTPKGGIMELPRGSTPIDFAYAVHTDVGNTCVAARIDRQFAPLSAELTNGQTIAVITSPAARPNPDWLNFVQTAKARSSIRHYLKNQHRDELINLGRQLLEKALADIKVEQNRITKKAFNIVLKEAKLSSLDSLYEEIGLGKRAAIFVAQQLINASKFKEDFAGKRREETPLLISGTEGIAVTLATCCNPIPGDHIAGILVPEKGLIIHRDSCAHITELRKHPERYILVRWNEDIKGEFHVTINVEMSSQRGTFADITRTIADIEAGIEDITVKERTGRFFVTTIVVRVHNLEHLKKLIRHLENLSSVTKVSRE